MLDWEEHLFLGLKSLYRQTFVRPEENRRAAVRVTLKERRASLLLLAHMLAGRPVGVLETPNPRLFGSERIFLPAEFSVASTREANAALFELRTILGALALRDSWYGHGTPLSARIHPCRIEFPHLHGRLEALQELLPSGTDIWTLLGQLPESDRPVDETVAASPGPQSHSPPATIATEIQGQGQASVSVLPGRDDDGAGADLPTHTFEKVETLEEYNGLSRKSDDADELTEHAEALSSLTMTQVMRSRERPRSIYRADILLDGLSIEVRDEGPASGIPYPEWDYRRREYRRHWCHVQESDILGECTEWVAAVGTKHRSLIQRLKRQFATLMSDWMRLRRQPIGAEFDMDALIQSETERRTGQTPDEFIYVDRKRDLHDVAALVLLDISYSTDAWLDNRHVLELITETVFCVGEVLEDYVEKFSLAAFTSNTRNSCRFDVLKRFDDSWQAARGRLGGLKPYGYTRIGPALRHAQELLLNEPASRKTIILVTDGRPCDYDRYEGRYGIQDVKKAIEVGKLHCIHTHAFAIEKQALEAFPQMFSRNDYNVLPRPEALAKTMCNYFARLLVH